MNVILPCSEREAAALLSESTLGASPYVMPTHGEVIDVFRLYHDMCWTEEDDSTTDPVFWTAHGNERYKKIRRRLKFLDKFQSKHKLLSNGLWRR